MSRLRSHRRLPAWVAILAILLASLAPLVSHALGGAAGTNSAWLEVCTASGSKWIAAGAQGSQGSDKAPATQHPLAHCPCCVGHAPALGVPPTSATTLVLLDLKQALPPAFLFAPRTPHAWVSAQPRAPPLAS